MVLFVFGDDGVAPPPHPPRLYPPCEKHFNLVFGLFWRQDGECGRPDAVIAAQSWEMFKMRDKSVLVDSLYGQFKSTLECPQCGKVR